MMKKIFSFVLLAFIGQAAQATSDEANYLSIAPFYIEPGETKTVELNLTNAVNVYSYQTVIHFPEGISVDTKTLPNGIEKISVSAIYERTYGEVFHTLTMNRLDNDKLMLVHHNSGEFICEFNGNNGAVAKITLVADEKLKSGVYNLEVRETVLTLAGTTANSYEEYKPVDNSTLIPVGVTSGECLTLAGAYHEEAIAVLNEALGSKSNINVIDMKGVTTFDGAVNIKNPNTLIYTSSEIGVTNEKNVVVNGVCDNLVLTDGYTFAPIESFTITNGTYNRTLDAGKYGTVVLPFAINDATKAAYEFYTLKRLNGDCLQFELVESPKAGVPYLYINKEETAATGFTAVANSESTAISESVPSDGWQMKATYTPISFTETDVLDKTYYISNNAVKNATKSLTINPFRAYISGPSYKETFNNQAQSIGIRLEGTTEIIPIEMIESSELYDLNGRVIENAEKGLYIKNGKKYYVK